jgi:hypothetical protein
MMSKGLTNSLWARAPRASRLPFRVELRSWSCTNMSESGVGIFGPASVAVFVLMCFRGMLFRALS